MFIVTVCSLLLFLWLAWSLMGAVLAASHPQSKALSVMWWAEPLEHWLSPGNTLELLPLSPGWWPALSPHPLTHPHKYPGGPPRNTLSLGKQRHYSCLLPATKLSCCQPIHATKPRGTPQTHWFSHFNWVSCNSILFFFFFFNIYLFACTVSSLGHAGFLWFQRSGLSLAAGTGFSLCWLLWL